MKETDYWLVFNKGNDDNENKYLWKNRGAWWIAITLINEQENRSVRRRFSLKTKDIEIARKRRDKVIAAINNHKGAISL